MSVPKQKVNQARHEDNRPDDYMIRVSGYPPYTKADDLRFVFAPYGKVKIKMMKHHSVVTLPDEASMADAIAHSKKVCVYGSFLLISRHIQQSPGKLREAFVRSMQRGQIIKPQKLGLSGDFSQQLAQILEAVRLTKEEVLNISTLYTDLEAALVKQWPDCCTVPFGSITTGLGIKSSDADCFVQMPRHSRQDDVYLVCRAKQILQQYPAAFDEVYAIPNANTPIVKFFHVPTETTCDVSFKNALGSRNSRLVAHLLQGDPRLLPLAVVIKYWAKVHELSGTGKMTNYALTLLVIFYLQHRLLLPAVEWLQRDVPEDPVDGWNTAFRARPDALPALPAQVGVADLLGGFFAFYADFDFGLLAVCPFLGHAVAKAAFAAPDALPDVLERYKANVRSKRVDPIRCATPVCIQDPFKLCYNVGSCITEKLAAKLKAYLKFAAAAYEQSKADGCADLLRTILLQDPPPTHGEKVQLTLRHRDFDRITRDEWKGAVEGVVRMLFEDICLVALEPLQGGEREETEARRFAFTLTKPIWSRKKLARPLFRKDDSFQQRQIRISQEIMNTCKDTLDLKGRIGIVPRKSSKVAVVYIEHVSGETCHYREFAKMFEKMMNGWFFEVVKGFLPPESEGELSDRLRTDCTVSDATAS